MLIDIIIGVPAHLLFAYLSKLRRNSVGAELTN
jgi:hypothetical protein